MLITVTEETQVINYQYRRECFRDVVIPIQLEIAWIRACDHFYHGTAQRTLHENVVTGHYGVASGSRCGTELSIHCVMGAKPVAMNTGIAGHHEGDVSRVSVYIPGINITAPNYLPGYTVYQCFT